MMKLMYDVIMQSYNARGLAIAVWEDILIVSGKEDFSRHGDQNASKQVVKLMNMNMLV